MFFFYLFSYYFNNPIDAEQEKSENVTKKTQNPSEQIQQKDESDELIQPPKDETVLESMTFSLQQKRTFPLYSYFYLLCWYYCFVVTYSKHIN